MGNKYHILKLKNKQTFLLILITAFILHFIYFIGALSNSGQLFVIENNFQKTEINLRYGCENSCFGFSRDTGRQVIEITNTTLPASLKHFNFSLNTKIPLLFQPKELCGEISVKLVIFITSITQEKRGRDVIRQTWLSVTKNNMADVRYFFILGRPLNRSYEKGLHNEIIENNDIVVYDFMDTYHNLTVKTLLGFRFATQRCIRAKYIMKTDTDVYVNLKAILTNLITNDFNITDSLRTERYINPVKYRNYTKDYHFQKRILPSHDTFGLLWHDTEPYRGNSKWFVSYEEYPEDVYPNYYDGHAYILSMKIARNVVKVSRKVPFFKFEDVYVGMCLKKLGYSLSDTPGFIRIGKHFTLCSHKFLHVHTVHRVTTDKMLKIWNASCPLYGILEEEVGPKRDKQWIKVNVTRDRNNNNAGYIANQIVKLTKFKYERSNTTVD